MKQHMNNGFMVHIDTKHYWLLSISPILVTLLLYAYNKADFMMGQMTRLSYTTTVIHCGGWCSVFHTLRAMKINYFFPNPKKLMETLEVCCGLVACSGTMTTVIHHRAIREVQKNGENNLQK